MFHPGEEAIWHHLDLSEDKTPMHTEEPVKVLRRDPRQPWRLWIEREDGVSQWVTDDTLMRPVGEMKTQEDLMRERWGDGNDRLPYKVRDRLREALRKDADGNERQLPIDWNGHWKNGAEWDSTDWIRRPEERYRELFYDFGFGAPLLTEEEAVRLAEAIETGTELPEFIPFIRMSKMRCTHCHSPHTLASNGISIKVLEPCPRPEGLLQAVIRLNVPSGKLVFANDLRSWFRTPADYDINSRLGCHLTTLEYGKIGMAHGFTGNTCPGIWRMPDGRILIANEPAGDRWDAEKKTYIPIPESERETLGGEAVGSICTDLWWYCAVDQDELQRRADYYNIPMPDCDMDILDVEPGVYEVRYNHEARKADDCDTLAVYAEFERVGDPEPLRDWVAEDAAKDYSAGQYLYQSICAWPDLWSRDKAWDDMDKEEQTKALWNAADHLLFTLGNGHEWHKNGFPLDCVNLPKRARSIRIPPFRFQGHVYPLDSAGAVSEAVGQRCWEKKKSKPLYMNPSFIKLALNMLQAVISYGAQPSSGDYEQEVERARVSMRKAVEFYRKLRKLYPDIVFDKRFDLWMMGEGREAKVEAWVERFAFPTPPKPKKSEPSSREELAASLEIALEIAPDDKTRELVQKMIAKQQGAE